MQISIADQRIILFPATVTREDAKTKAREKKQNAFGAISQLTGFFNKPKDEEFEIEYEEFRYQPFWHVAARAKYVYDRTNDYQVPASGPEVRTVTYENTSIDVTNSHFHLRVLEHCTEEISDEALVNGVTGKTEPSLRKYISHASKTVDGQIDTLVPKGTIIVPPQSRVSAIMRDSLSKMIKGIQADAILEETVEVPCVDLYYHPVYAFKFRWVTKNKDAIVEIDGLTGDVSTGTRVFSQYLGKSLDRDFLFDIGADAAGILVPGGSIAVKAAKKYIDSRKK